MNLELLSVRAREVSIEHYSLLRLVKHFLRPVKHSLRVVKHSLRLAKPSEP